MSGLFWWSAETTTIGLSEHLAAVVFGRHLCRYNRALAAQVGVNA